MNPFIVLRKLASLERSTIPRVRLFNKIDPFVGQTQSWRSVSFGTSSIPTALEEWPTEKHNAVRVMEQEVTWPDPGFLYSLLQECIRLRDIRRGKQLHAHILKYGYGLIIYADNNLINMYVKCGNMENARQVFDRLHERNVISWTTVISGYCRMGNPHEALNLFLEIRKEGIVPNQFTYSTILPVCAGLQLYELGKQVHSHICRANFESDVFVDSALINMYAKSNSIEDARQVFDKMSTRNRVSWNSMIVGYAQNTRYDEAVKLFTEIPLESIKPDEITYSSVLSACANLAALEQGRQLHGQIIKVNAESEGSAVGNALVDMYAKCKTIGDACKVFDRVPIKDAITWNVMIVGCAQNAYFEEAYRIFCEMQHNGIKLDEISFSSVLSACSSLAALEQGKLVHAHIIETGFGLYTCTGNGLVDMYSKCGRIEEAFLVFIEIPERNVVSWTAMITGCAQHGRAMEVIELFEQMQLADIKPDYITFVCVLSACSHSGLVDEGIRYFELMTRDHGIAARAEHYACLVDLLGRAGRVKEAESVIDTMPVEPTASVWGALLSACRIHCNLEIGSRAANRLFKLEPNNSGNYVLLSNIYAAAGRWEDVSKVRRMMDDNRVKKEPGCSWVEVRNRVHTFTAADSSHPQAAEIYAMLDRLTRKMKKEGYVPDTQVVLYDVEERQKEQILHYHSEKLALAFGLISIPSGVPIQIKKNLRVCNDCHTAIKFISKIVDREIIVRDITRFHHFKHGLCSCGDYW